MAICIFSVGLLRDHGGDVLFYPCGGDLGGAHAGACLGFLPHNFYPARIFMGDSGSMLVGLMLAAASTTAAGPISQSAYGARRLHVALTLPSGGGGDVRPGPGHVAGHRAADPGGTQPVQSGQDAPAPPAAADRPLAPPCRPADLPAGGGGGAGDGEHHFSSTRATPARVCWPPSWSPEWSP